MRIQSLLLNGKGFAMIRNGSKTETSRYGIRDIKKGPLLIINRDNCEETEIVEVTNITQKKFSEISIDNALAEGFATIGRLKAFLIENYDLEDINDDTMFTFVSFVNFQLPIVCFENNLKLPLSKEIRKGLAEFVVSHPVLADEIAEMVEKLTVMTNVINALDTFDYEPLDQYLDGLELSHQEATEIAELYYDKYVHGYDERRPDVGNDYLTETIDEFLENK